MKPLEKNYKRIVVKIGSSLFYPKGTKVDLGIINKIADQVTVLVESGKEIVVVSSGAIAFGLHVLGLVSRPKDLPHLQAAAATGQNLLMESYSNAFKEKKINCAQILLTWDDFNNRKRYLNAKNTLIALLKLRNVVPIINENDTVSTDEIKFGDNDRLSALVASLISADILIILSDVDGLLDKDKKVIPEIFKITPWIKAFACPTSKQNCVGGMITKIEAAKIAVDSGIPCVIANGYKKDIITSVIKEPEKYGSLFLPKEGLTARKRWIAFGTKPKGRVVVDDGAKKALINKKSLLSVGVVAAEGNFDAGDIISVIDKQDCEIARGRVGVSSKQLDKIKGSRYDKEVIHRDNIVIL
ncbi:MAG: glutamate 5-kinase [Candidatus Omnitrophica bacterium]|nr:glutamate 5-kinase [Candidatus Omnitrophota bacterium]